MKTMRPKFVPKPWGWELWIAHTPKYTGKILFIKKGGRLSRQYHRWKDETIHVDSGVLSMEVNGRTRPLKKGTSIRVRPGTIHRMSAEKGPVRLIETSTSQVLDVVRLSDDYGRVERPHTRRRPQ
ncbi:MAG TPA: cupin domain-containing protein [Elusimicrobiota bacterium]|nr:cupin domain-containing protein [Elusimicrobiota bacterium]